MKNNNIKIAVIEDGEFYNQLIENQVFDLCQEKQYKTLNWVIKSFEDVESFKGDKGNAAYQAIIFDNHLKNGNMNTGYNVQDIIDAVKVKNNNCLFISISGYREMVITAEHYIDGELQFYYSKQSNIKNQCYEEVCSIPSIHKLMDKFITDSNERLDVASQQKKVVRELKISA